ncbi:MAG TPA: PadR family transcriptional regulator [Phenylobacterium sp.]|uniref:PadR family transcriptional regulator n=1 Tax=Phenylobacterium sp. TaxID=1871053 RepID=UPI002CDAB2D2|nr:PadR family transcriptional regulator [Phenylobacterium sp.]HSV01672.1 PadR family transcriptional regulator [Phenylobacterium sp.]
MFHHHHHARYEERMREHWKSYARGRMRGRRLGRLLEHGDLRFVVLALIAEQPRHGYELIKELEERTGGAYRPSAGVIYPTLSLLEDEGLVRQAGGEIGRKLYEPTEEGKAALAQSRAHVDAIFARIAEAAESSESSRPRIARAMTNLGMALQHRLSRRPITSEEIDRIVNILDDTASAIEKS